MTEPEKEDLFFIGWQPEMQKTLKSKVRAYAIILALITVITGSVIAAFQETYGISRYDYTDLREIEGIFRADPYPHLTVHIPNTDQCRSYMLVDQFKENWPRDLVTQYDGQFVKMSVGSIYRGDVTMFEGDPLQEIQTLDLPQNFPVQPEVTLIGEQTLIGEIIDSKCYYGAMNPGNLKTHRACATVCIKGGIPPVLLVRRKNDVPLYFFLTDTQGAPVIDEIIDYIAEPIQLTGTIESQCGLLMLSFDPATIRRI